MSSVQMSPALSRKGEASGLRESSGGENTCMVGLQALSGHLFLSLQVG